MNRESRLRCDVRLIRSPYQEREAIDVWGEVALTIEADGGQTPLLVWQWDLDQLGDWYTENVTALCAGELVIKGERPLPSESLGEALDRFRDRDFDDAAAEVGDRWFDAIYEYRREHGLRFAFPGTRLPDIIVGCHRGDGEISLSPYQGSDLDYEEGPLSDNTYVRLGGWSYRFGMHTFLVELHDGLERILTEWLASERDPLARKSVGELLERLPAVPCEECCGATG